MSNIEFHLSIFLCLTLGMVASGFAIQLGLRIYWIESTYADVAAIYTAYVMCYQPLLNLFSYFGSVRIFSLLESARGQGLDLDRTVSFIWSQAAIAGNRHDLIGSGSRLCSWFLLSASCVAGVFMATTIAERYSVSRLKSLSAITFAIVVLVPPIGAIAGIAVMYAEYVFMSPSGTAVAPH